LVLHTGFLSLDSAKTAFIVLLSKFHLLFMDLLSLLINYYTIFKITFLGGIMFSKTKFFNQPRFVSNKQFSKISIRDSAFPNIDNNTKVHIDKLATLKKQEIHKLENQYGNLESKLQQKTAELNARHKELRALQHDLVQSNVLRERIESYATMILDELYKAKITGDLRVKTGADYGFDSEIFAFFQPILWGYGVSCSTSVYYGQGEIVDYLHLEFPQTLPLGTLVADAEDKEYSDWLLEFDKKLVNICEKADSKIKTDLEVINKNLYEPLKDQQEGSKTFFKGIICSAALELFKNQRGDILDIQVIDRSFITAIKKETPNYDNEMQDTKGFSPF
jgi:hypothetical protein